MIMASSVQKSSLVSQFFHIIYGFAQGKSAESVAHHSTCDLSPHPQKIIGNVFSGLQLVWIIKVWINEVRMIEVALYLSFLVQSPNRY